MICFFIGSTLCFLESKEATNNIHEFFWSEIWNSWIGHMWISLPPLNYKRSTRHMLQATCFILWQPHCITQSTSNLIFHERTKHLEIDCHLPKSNWHISLQNLRLQANSITLLPAWHVRHLLCLNLREDVKRIKYESAKVMMCSRPFWVYNKLSFF